MDDEQIIELFFKRDEDALTKIQEQYGAFCNQLAMNILRNREDAEECVNDALTAVWNRIPPFIPKSLKAYMGRVVRNAAISRYRNINAQKRNAKMTMYLSEIEDCIPSEFNVELQINSKALSKSIDLWLASIKKEDAMLFVRRYWYGDSVSVLAEKSGIPPAKLSQNLLRLRKQLKKYLKGKEFDV